MRFIGRLAVAGLLLLTAGVASADRGNRDYPVKLTVFAPAEDDVAGVGSSGFLVDFAAEFPGDLASTGASLELTGPGPHTNAPPFPGTFSPGADKDHFPGLVVLLSSTQVGARAGQNVANLFNIIAVTNRTATSTEIWGTWIIGAKNTFGLEGQEVPATLFVTVVDGQAPDAVEDLNGDGSFDNKDLKLMGFRPLAKGRSVEFVVNGF
jgi:hypothetical protein